MKVKNANKDVVTVIVEGANVILQPDEIAEVDEVEGIKCCQEKGCVKVRGGPAKPKEKEAPKEAKPAPEAVPEEKPKEAPKEVPKEAPKEAPKAAPKEKPKPTAKKKKR